MVYSGAPRFIGELADRIPSAKVFVDAYQKAYGFPPGDYGATAYSAIRNLLTATQKVGALHNDEIVTALKDLSYDNYKGKEWFRPCTHQSFQDFYILRSRASRLGSGVISISWTPNRGMKNPNEAATRCGRQPRRIILDVSTRPVERACRTRPFKLRIPEWEQTQ
jgi:hypothetical protein